MTKFRILLVDDDHDDREEYADALKSGGYDVRECATVDEASAVIQKEPNSFDLAVIDLMLRKIPGDTSGKFVAQEVKRIKKPVIMLTRSSDLEDILDTLNVDVGGGPLAARAVHKTRGTPALLELIRNTVVHKVFVAHGHDLNTRNEIVVCLRTLGLQPIIIGETATEGMTIIESIEKYSNVSFAVIVLTPDDIGGEDRAKLKPRARQNVILEWGFFIGQLGREHVIALYKVDDAGPLELPSNQGGLRYITIDAGGDWRHKLAAELEQADIPVDASRIKG